MIKPKTWFDRPAAALCLFVGIVIVSVFILVDGNVARKSSGDLSYMITQRHYGINAKEMERTVAVPLEDAFSSISGIKNILSVSENSMVRVYLEFRRDSSVKNICDTVREAAQKVYETLPSSAQRPEYSFSDEAGIPVWTAAIVNFPSGDYLRKNIKPVFESIEGVAEVELSGIGTTEIIVAPDPERIAGLGIDYRRVIEVLGMNDAIFSGGKIRIDNLETLVTVDGRFATIASMKDMPVPVKHSYIENEYAENGSFVRLGDIANVYEAERESDTVSRLNGKETAIISVAASSGTDLGMLSRRIQDKCNGLSEFPLEISVLQDRGLEESKALRSVFVAAFEASVLVAVMSLLLAGNARGFFPGIVCAAVIPFISIISAALLAFMGFPADRKLLAGLSIGIGAAADSVLFAVDGFGKAVSKADGKKVLAAISAPLAAGTVTTCVALFPLSFFSDAEDINVIVWSLVAVSITALAVALVILPPMIFFFKKPVVSFGQKNKFAFVKKTRRTVFRFLSMLIRFCAAKPFVVPLIALFVTFSALFVIFRGGSDISSDESKNSVFIRIQFDRGLRKEEVDRRMVPWARALKEYHGITAVQSTAQPGSGKVLVTFDSQKTTGPEVRSAIRSEQIAGGYIFIPESSKDEKLWEIKIFGDDDEACRELAKKAAALADALPFVLETSLDFREGDPGFMVIPDRERFAESGLSFSAAADMIRRGVYGPVIYKRITENGEFDVRLKFPDSSGEESIPEETLMRLPVNSQKTRLDSVAVGLRHNAPSIIRRENRRRVASFTIRTGHIDPARAAEQVMSALSPLDLPPGYKAEFDPEAIRKAEAVSGTGLRFAAALLICYMVIAAINESFKFPLVILAAVPPSLAVPVLLLALSGTPMNAALACSLVAVSGITVNAAIIAAGELRSLPGCLDNHVGGFYRALRRCFPILCSTSGTTIIGGLPFIFLSEGGNSMLRSLSLVTVFGVGASWIYSLVLIPSLFVFFRKLRRR